MSFPREDAGRKGIPKKLRATDPGRARGHSADPLPPLEASGHFVADKSRLSRRSLCATSGVKSLFRPTGQSRGSCPERGLRPSVRNASGGILGAEFLKRRASPEPTLGAGPSTSGLRAEDGIPVR